MVLLPSLDTQACVPTTVIPLGLASPWPTRTEPAERPSVLKRVPGLRVPLSQLLKNGPHGSRQALMQNLVQERPGICRLRCLRCLQLRGARLDLGPFVLAC